MFPFHPKGDFELSCLSSLLSPLLWWQEGLGMSQRTAQERGFPGLASSSFLSKHPASKTGWDEGRWEKRGGTEGMRRRPWGFVLVEGWRRRSPKPTSHHPGPQPAPGSWGRGWGSPHPPRGRRIQNNRDEARGRHRPALGAAPLAGAVLRAECSVSLLPAARDTRALPRVTRAASAAHKGIQALPAGRNCCIPSSEFWTRGISATCRCCTVVPKTQSDSHSPLPGLQLLALAGMAQCGCCGIPTAVVEQGGHPGQTQVTNTGVEACNSRACFAFTPGMCHLWMSKSELLHFMQLWKSLFPAPEPPGCVWRTLQNGAEWLLLSFHKGLGSGDPPKVQNSKE